MSKRNIFAKTSFLAVFLFGGVCPLCIPKIAIIASVLGISLLPGGSLVSAIIMHALFLYILYNSLCNYHKHKNVYPFVLTALSTTFLIVYYYIHPKFFVLPTWSIYISIVLIAAAAMLDLYSPRLYASRSQEKGHCCS